MSSHTCSTRCLTPLVLSSALVLALASAPAFAGKVNLGGLRNGQTYSQFIVKYRAGSPERKDAAARTRSLNRAAQAVKVTVAPTAGKSGVAGPGRRAIGLGHMRRMGIGADVIRAERGLDRVDAETLMRKLAADPNVEYVEINGTKRALMTPNDPRYTEQWHYANTATGANVARAWDSSNGSGIAVAVIDTGSVSHPDMNANYLGGYDFVSLVSPDAYGDSGDGDGRDPDPKDERPEGHGVHVAGTIAAVTNNGVGVAGVAYGAKVVPVRVLGNLGYGNDADIIDAIVWAAGGAVPGVPANPNPAEVINMSLGGTSPCSFSYQESIDYAVGHGTTVVVAAGNSNNDTSTSAPANCANVIAVAASDPKGNRAYYSNYGAMADITAPGGELCSPLSVEFLPLGQAPTSSDCNNYKSEDGVLSLGRPFEGVAYYDFEHGTSMAAPHVAGIVALMQAASATPKTPARIEAILKNTARPIPSSKCPGGCGAGLIDAAAAVAAAAGSGDGGGNLEPAASFTFSASGRTVSFSDTSTDSDGSIATRVWNFGDGTTSTVANPSHIYAANGAYAVTLTVTDNGGATNYKRALVGATLDVLANGVPATGIALDPEKERLWTMAVPAGATNLKFVISGNDSFNASVHAKFGAAPTDSSYDCRQERYTDTVCTIASPKAGTYYVRVSTYVFGVSGASLTGSYTSSSSNAAPVANFTSSTSGLTATFTDASTDSDGTIASRVWDFGDGTSSTVTSPSHTYAAAGTYNVKLTVTDNGGLTSSKTAAIKVASAPSCGGTVLCSGTAVALPSVTKGGVSSNYTLVVPAGKTSVTFTISGGTGDADMYVRLGSAPTSSTYDCRPYKTGNAETCTMTPPAAGGTYYVNVRAYAAYSGVSLKGTISP